MILESIVCIQQFSKFVGAKQVFVYYSDLVNCSCLTVDRLAVMRVNHWNASIISEPVYVKESLGSLLFLFGFWLIVESMSYCSV